MTTRRLGNRGEQLAKDYLKRKGYTFVTQNYRTRLGEIDLIFKQKQTIIFVEVKARKKKATGLPEEAVTPRKIHTITTVAHQYLIEHKLTDKLARIDVVAIEYTNDSPTIRHIENITG